MKNFEYPRFRLIALLSIACCSARVSAAEPLLRVMTFNLRFATAADGENSWAGRKDILLEAIRKFDPDLLGTQETLASQADFLVESLPGNSLVGVGREDGKRQGEFSALMFKKARFDLIDSGTFWLSETPDKVGSKSWDSSLPRIATWVRLRDKSAAVEKSATSIRIGITAATRPESNRPRSSAAGSRNMHPAIWRSSRAT